VLTFDPVGPKSFVSAVVFIVVVNLKLHTRICCLKECCNDMLGMNVCLRKMEDCGWMKVCRGVRSKAGVGGFVLLALI
jgi:hypothetical protein